MVTIVLVFPLLQNSNFLSLPDYCCLNISNWALHLTSCNVLKLWAFFLVAYNIDNWPTVYLGQLQMSEKIMMMMKLLQEKVMLEKLQWGLQIFFIYKKLHGSFLAAAARSQVHPKKQLFRRFPNGAIATPRSCAKRILNYANAFWNT